MAMTLRDMVSEALNVPVSLKRKGGNLATWRTMQTEVTSWRTHHYAMDVAWIRDMVEEEAINVSHISGKVLVADALTKVLDRSKLEEARWHVGLFNK